jgi:hypothetical protein
MSDTVGSVSVEVVPSAQGFSERLRTDILPEADAIGQEAGERIKAGIDDHLDDIRLGAHLDDAEAKAEIDDLKLKVDELKHDNANIDVTVNNSSGVRGWLTSLIAGAVAIAPAFAVAGVGIGAFVALAVPSISKVVAYEEALGTNAATAAKDWAKLTDQQKVMATEIGGLRSEFGDLSREIQPEVLSVFNAALDQAALILHEIAPLAEAGGRALTGLISDVGSAFTGSSGQQFFQFVAKNLEPDVAEIGQTVSALIKTFFSLVEALQPVSLGLLHVVTGGADLLSWLSRVAPPLDDVIVLAIALYKPLQVIKALDIASTFANLSKALSGVAVASNAQGLQFAWVTKAVTGIKELVTTTTAAAAVDAAMAAETDVAAASITGFAVAADGTAVAMDELTVSETAAAVAAGALDAVNPLAWAGLAIAAIAALAYGLSKVSSSTANLTQHITAQNNATGFNTQGYFAAAAAIGKYNDQQEKTSETLVSLHTGMSEGTTSAGQLSGATQDLTAAQQKLVTEGNNQKQFFADLQANYGLTRAQAEAFGSQVGVTADDVNKGGQSLKDAEQNIAAFDQAIAQASKGTGALDANNQVLTFSANQQSSAVGKLATAWSTYITSLTGTQGTFDTYALGMASLSTAAKASGASFGGLSKASLTLNQTFQGQLTSLQAVSGALRTSGVGAKVFDSGIQGGTATMIKFAQGNKVAQAELLAFARQADGGINSFKGLEQWVGNTAGGAKKLQDAMDQAAISEAKMSQESKQLGQDLESDVSNMMAVAALRTSGAQQAIDKLTSSLEKNNTTTAALRSVEQKSVDVLVKAGLTTAEATREVNALIAAHHGEALAAQNASAQTVQLMTDFEKAGASAQQAAIFVKRLQDYIDQIHGKTVNVGVHIEETTTGSGTVQGQISGTTLRGAAAGGAVVPGYAPGRDTETWKLSPGEGVAVPELVRAIGPARFMDLNKEYGGGRKSTGSALAGGGVISDTSSFPQDIFNFMITLPSSSGGWGRNNGWGSSGGGGDYGRNNSWGIDGLPGELKPGSNTTTLNDDGKALAKAFENAYKDTAAQIKAETKTALSDIREFYSGPAATHLEATIRDQGTALEHLATASANLAAKIANIKAYAAQETQSLESFSDISTITGGTDANGNALPVTGLEIKTGLQQDLNTLRKFFAIIKQLKNAGVDKVMIAQVIALGPADGVTYGEAILAGGKSLIAEINSEEKQISAIDIRIGQRAADVQFGQPLAKGFLSGLDKEKSELDKRMKALGEKIAQELEKALHGVKIKVASAGSSSAAAVSADALGSATSVGGTITAPHIISKSDVAEIRTSLRTIASRELNLMTKAQAAKVISLLEAAPKATGAATGSALASELNGIAKNAATAARARTR